LVGYRGVDESKIFVRTAESHVHILAAGQKMYVFLDRKNGGERIQKPRLKMFRTFFSAAPPHAGWAGDRQGARMTLSKLVFQPLSASGR
jgi:hypothetical protein